MLFQLEMINGEIWANVWQTECIARICPATGVVNGWVLMQGLRGNLLKRNLPQHGTQMDVLNGKRGIWGSLPWGLRVGCLGTSHQKEMAP